MHINVKHLYELKSHFRTGITNGMCFISDGSELIMKGAHIAAIVICSAICAAVLIVAGAVAR